MAALGIVAYHYCVRINELYPEIDVIFSVAKFGVFGVPVFFVLSGYVISLSTQGRSTRDFLIGRAARILPTYWFAVTFTYVCLLPFDLPGRKVSFVEYLANYLLLARLAGVPDVDGVYWSLALEAIFYLAVAAALSLSLWPRRQVHLLVTWTIVAIFWSVVGLAGDPGLPTTASDFFALIGYLMLTEYAAYFVGGAALQMFHRHQIGFGAMLAILAGTAFSSWLYGGFVHLVALVLTVAVIDVSKYRGIALLRSGALIWAGTISYSLYLIHQNLGFVALRGLHALSVPRLLAVVVVFVGALGVAQLVHHVVEAPAARHVRARQQRRQNAQRDGSSSAKVLSSDT